MKMLLALFDGVPALLWQILGVGALVLGAYGWAHHRGYAAAVAKLQPQIASAQAKATQWQGAAKQLQAAINAQNAALDAARQAEAERTREVARAQALAHDASLPLYQRAKDLLDVPAKPLPAAGPARDAAELATCRTAASDFDAELRSERGAK